ncbi:MAG: hypothetical protein J7551_09820 [Chloroflexi bacterium]|jgi:hypothetical protein|nr:hypothetical protein [Chloroflexota bacterium]
MSALQSTPYQGSKRYLASNFDPPTYSCAALESHFVGIAALLLAAAEAHKASRVLIADNESATYSALARYFDPELLAEGHSER